MHKCTGKLPNALPGMQPKKGGGGGGKKKFSFPLSHFFSLELPKPSPVFGHLCFYVAYVLGKFWLFFAYVLGKMLYLCSRMTNK